jgi:hypothetical protein
MQNRYELAGGFSVVFDPSHGSSIVNLWTLHDYAIAISGFPGTHKFLLLVNGMQVVVFLQS